MSFSTDFKALITADSSINYDIKGGIHWENLPENFEISKNWIVYSFAKGDQESCLTSTAAFTRYNIALKVICTDSIVLERVSDRIVSYLGGNSYGNIADVLFIGDSHSLDLDKNIYINTLQFNALYF